MEPLRGGKLVNALPAKAKELIANHPKKYSAAEWALRWLWDQPGVTCVLSGMNSEEMVAENVRIASAAQHNMAVRIDSLDIVVKEDIIDIRKWIGDKK